MLFAMRDEINSFSVNPKMNSSVTVFVTNNNINITVAIFDGCLKCLERYIHIY